MQFVKKRRMIQLGVGVGSVACVAFLALAVVNKLAGHETPVPTTSVNQADDDGDDAGANEAAIAVTTIKPKRDKNFAMTFTEEPADVEPYYEVPLEAQAAGPVEYIQKAIGSPISKGEVLVKISVPDRDQTLAWKQAIVDQKKKDVKLAHAAINIATAAVKEADTDIALRQDEAEVAELNMKWRHEELDRVKVAADPSNPAISPEVTQEQILKTKVADSDCKAAQHAVDKAKADKLEIQAKLEKAKADLELQQSLVHVAEKDRDLAQAMVNYATVRAPFDGEIKQRYVNPGSLVQNASNGTPATPLLSVQRTDIVTVTIRLPDKYAPYITSNTDAIIQLASLPGLVIHGKVTRHSMSLINAQHDRTMEVQVDLYNGTDGDYKAWLDKEKKKTEPFDDLKKGPLPVPLFPQDERVDDPDGQRLMPGMIGRMTLVLKRFKNAYLIPSSALVEQGGTHYLYIVKKGAAHLQQVDVLVNDENLAKIALVEKNGKDTATRPLTGDEEIVYTGQGELNDGTPVKTHLEEWHR